ncbi:Uncharacterised protein [Candidatus Bilamarchaeum dharawalense]|uniref:RelA/SpoT domain-containing protein n=1 Tax=Candidatus Bilamarchaeum dharawalense TaxID=2885759 RepID=A0A5E4LNT9_9ARCH|nr:Uncharacterised protein [Candidatus Bilamarchaeum dharawalense]
MHKLEAPRSLNAIVRSAQNFYSQRGAMHYYEHAHAVLDTARRSRIVESSVLTDKKETMERKWANAALAAVSLYHVVERRNISSVIPDLPPELRNDRVLSELDTFCRITDTIRAGGTLQDLIPLLNGGQAPLALLVVLSDYAVTHNTEDRLSGLIDPKHQSIFRCYNSFDEAFLSMRLDAMAGENVFAPVAELFGYPKLAGTILKHSYRVNHRPLYDFVNTIMTDEIIQQRLAITQRAVKELGRHIGAILREYGFEADLEYRPVKSEGKLMRKIYRILQEEHAHAIETPDAVTSTLLDNYLVNALPHFESFKEIHDWSAARVILRRYKGKDIDNLSADEQAAVYELAKRVVDFAVGVTAGQVRADYEYKFIQKDNGYKGGHWDIFPSPHVSSDGFDLITTALNFEVQLKLHEWHEVAEHGKAAHYYYIGGDPAFMQTLNTAYHNIIHYVVGKKPKLVPNGRV